MSDSKSPCPPPGDGAKTEVLIVCTGNACRSQMAEALWRHLAGDRYEVTSAGTYPAGVHPLARHVIEELGIDAAGQFSKSVFSLEDRSFDLVVTVCDDAREICPVFPGHPQQLHWPFLDPILAPGTEPERLEAFRYIRDQIRAKIEGFLAAAGPPAAPGTPVAPPAAAGRDLPDPSGDSSPRRPSP